MFSFFRVRKWNGDPFGGRRTCRRKKIIGSTETMFHVKVLKTFVRSFLLDPPESSVKQYPSTNFPNRIRRKNKFRRRRCRRVFRNFFFRSKNVFRISRKFFFCSLSSHPITLVSIAFCIRYNFVYTTYSEWIFSVYEDCAVVGAAWFWCTRLRTVLFGWILLIHIYSATAKQHWNKAKSDQEYLLYAQTQTQILYGVESWRERVKKKVFMRGSGYTVVYGPDERATGMEDEMVCCVTARNTKVESIRVRVVYSLNVFHFSWVHLLVARSRTACRFGGKNIH